MAQITSIGLLLLLALFGAVSIGEGRNCRERFVTPDQLREKSLLLGSFAHSEEEDQWLFPYLNFSCPTVIHSFHILVQDSGEGARKNDYPRVQIWRPQNTNGDRFDRIHEMPNTLTPMDGSANIYRTPDLTYSVQSRDVVGFYQPEISKSRFILYFQSQSGRSGLRLANRRDPLMHFNVGDPNLESGSQLYPLIGVTLDNPECASGLLSEADLVTKNVLLSMPTIPTPQLASHHGQTRVIPGLSFGCNGLINSVTFSATQGTGDQYPELQIWRQQHMNEYRLLSSIVLDNPAIEHLNSFKFTFNQTLTVQSNDAIGIVLPNESNTALALQFLNNMLNPGIVYFPRSFTLPPGAAVDFIDTSTAQSTHDYHLPLLVPEMVADCGPLVAPDNGMVTLPSTLQGSTAVYSCSDGYSIDGDSERLCLAANGRWNSTRPDCNPVDCGDLVSPLHGRVDLESSLYQSEARYSCDEGFTLSGSLLRTCTGEGNWSEGEPVCEGLQCPIIMPPANGALSIETQLADSQYGALATYSCQSNHTLIGEGHRTCDITGNWTGEAPVCAADCDPPPELAHGSVAFTSTAVYSLAAYSCSEGYSLHDNRSGLECGESSTWEGQLPHCQAVRCPDLVAVENGVVVFTNGTSYNSTAHYNCSHGYHLSGPSSRTCSNESQWSGSETKCVLSVTESPDPTGPRLLDEVYLAVIAVIALMVVVILVMVAIICCLCAQRRKYKAVEMSFTMETDNSLDNPVYEGDQRLSFNMWNPNMRSYGLHLRNSVHSSDSAHSDNESIYEQPYGSNHSLNDGSRKPSLHYEVSSVINPSIRSCEPIPVSCDMVNDYDEPVGRLDVSHHYDTASNYKLSTGSNPASPYELPSPTKTSSTIYGSLAWGTYVPTEEQRQGTISSLPSPVLLERKSGSKDSLVDGVFFAESEVYWMPASDPASLYEQLARNRYREILKEQIQVTAHLGSGQFGTVDKGLWQSAMGVREVAIKTLKDGSSEIDKVKFLQEAAINGQFQHQNVVKLHGVVTMGDEVMIVLELLTNGDLHTYLNRCRLAPGELVASDTVDQLLRYCTDIAAGMEYLSSKAFIHRDLAARNILVTVNRTCKIGDFGMSRDLMDESYYMSQGGKIPVKWTAPEAIHYKKYSTASDVWSFGCVMYEIWSLGHKPFKGCSNTAAISLIDRGYRLPPPPGCPRDVYELMIHCWNPNHSLRPSFDDLHQVLVNDIPHMVHNDKDSQLVLLGAPLELSKDTYPDLRNYYLPAQ